MKWGGGGDRRRRWKKGTVRKRAKKGFPLLEMAGGGEVCLYFLLYFLSLLFDVLAGHFLVGLRGRALILYW